jgi:hypothetical protein
MLIVTAAFAAHAHDLQYTVTGGQAVVIKLFYVDNTPFTFEGYEIYREGEKLPYQVGRTDSQGRIAFLPDRAATWRIKAISEDGHGLDFKLGTDAAAVYRRGKARLRTLWPPRRRRGGDPRPVRLPDFVRETEEISMKSALPVVLPLALALAPPRHRPPRRRLPGRSRIWKGPGAPVETSSSATLPEGNLAGLRQGGPCQVQDRDRPGAGVDNAEGDYNQYWMLGLGYGFKPWLSGYAFSSPTTSKIDEADGRIPRASPIYLWSWCVIGFKYDEGLMLVPTNESLDDMMDWHFTGIYGGLSLPTGDANHRLDDGGH